MRLLGRIFLVAAGALVPAVVTSIGCGVQGDRYPGLGNEVPNNGANPGPSGNTGGSASSSSSSGTSGGVSVNVCQCSATITSVDGGDCATCGGQAVGATGPCNNENVACVADPACQVAVQCVAKSCATATDYAQCVSDCIANNATYLALITCQCNTCQQLCAVISPIACALDDGGADGGADDGGDAGTADAGDGG